MEKVLSIILTICMVVGIIMPSNISFASDIDEGALEVFLDKLARLDSGKRKDGVILLEVYLEDEVNGVKDLKRDLHRFLNEDHIKAIEKEGYTLDDVKNELDQLGSWSLEDRLKLVEYISDGNASGIRSLIKDVENNSESNNGGNSSSGGDKPRPDDENKGEDKEDIEELLEVKFKDIDADKHKEDIIFLAERAIIKGKTEEKFEPNSDLTRAEFMTLVYRVLELESDKNKALPFKDVKTGAWYYEYVKAAYDNKIINGKSKNLFAPESQVTREEIAVITMRILDFKEITHTLESVDKDLLTFKDSNKISSWAKDQMFYGVKYGIIEGRTENQLSPRAFATRGEAANIIKKLYDALEK